MEILGFEPKIMICKISVLPIILYSLYNQYLLIITLLYINNIIQKIIIKKFYYKNYVINLLKYYINKLNIQYKYYIYIIHIIYLSKERLERSRLLTNKS